MTYPVFVIIINACTMAHCIKECATVTLQVGKKCYNFFSIYSFLDDDFQVNALVELAKTLTRF